MALDMADLGCFGDGRLKKGGLVAASDGFLAVGEFSAERVLIVDVGCVDLMQHHVHRGDAKHGHIEIEAISVLMVLRIFYFVVIVSLATHTLPRFPNINSW